MKLEEFDFYLPEELIAQTPLKNRTESRLLVVDPKQNKWEHKHFINVIDYLQPGDCLVLNDTRVLPARLYGTKEETGASIEVLLLHEMEGSRWKTLVKPAKRVKEGTIIKFGDGRLIGKCVGTADQGEREIDFQFEGIFYEVLDSLGEMPLPPYIKEKLDDKERYQTVYAKHQGSVAAPTAGLHFTEELLKQIEEKGVSLAYVTLHVGLGTFRPVSVDTIEEHKMHGEYYQLTEGTARLLNKVKEQGGRIVAVGTTSCRTLETVASKFDGEFKQSSGWTDIFIYPGYEFKGINGLITNFHLPKSTLLMLVSALSNRELMLDVYRDAVEERYRFFSFGDAMLILEGSLS